MSFVRLSMHLSVHDDLHGSHIIGLLLANVLFVKVLKSFAQEWYR